VTGADGGRGTLGKRPSFIDGLYLAGQKLQAPPQEALLAEQSVPVDLYSTILFFQRLKWKAL